MQKPIYSNADSKRLTVFIRAYYVETDPDKKAQLYMQITNKIQILLYLIPQKFRLVNEDYIGDFYLDIATKVPQIIDSYRLSKIDFLPFLVQIIKYRAKFFMLHAYNIEKEREDLLCFDAFLNEDTVEYTPYQKTEEETVEENYLNPNNITKTDLYPICETIVKLKPTDIEFEDKEANFLHNYLKKKAARRAIIMILLSTHNELSNEEIEHWAEVYDCQTFHFDNLNIAMKLWSAKKIEQAEKLQTLSIAHWKRLLKYDEALMQCLEPESRQEILLLKKRCLTMIDNNYAKIKDQNKGLTINQIADIFFKNSNTVSVTICKTKKELKANLKELNLNQPSAIIDEKPITAEDSNETLFCQQQ